MAAVALWADDRKPQSDNGDDHACLGEDSIARGVRTRGFRGSMGRGRCVGILVCSSHEWRERVEVEVSVVRVVVVNTEGDIAP